MSDIARENAALRSRVATLEAGMHAVRREVSGIDRAALESARTRADGVAGLFGERVSEPALGESELNYRWRLARQLQKHSPRYRSAQLVNVGPSVLKTVEDVLYADAAAAAYDPSTVSPGQMREIKRRDAVGREITRYVGSEIGDWFSAFTSSGQRVAINRGLT